jgi:hypothetical protein
MSDQDQFAGISGELCVGHWGSTTYLIGPNGERIPYEPEQVKPAPAELPESARILPFPSIKS